jgi:hypothetical protein
VFEVEIQNILSNLSFSYEANPVSEYAWKRSNIKHRVDIVLTNGLRIECKHVDGRVYLSWFKRDWLSKGSCVFVFKGDLKLSPAIIEQYHPIVLHYFLLPVYLKYQPLLFRGVTSLYEASVFLDIFFNILAGKYVTGRLELERSGNRTVTQSMVSSSREKRLSDESINVEATFEEKVQAKTRELSAVCGITHGGDYQNKEMRENGKEG